MPKSSPEFKVLQFTRPPVPAPTVDLAIPLRVSAALPVDETPALDLSGKPQVVMLIGRQRVGKTLTARWVIERKDRSKPENRLVSSVVTGAVTLGLFVDGVAHPDGRDPAEFLGDLLGFQMNGKHRGVIDMGGADTSLPSVLDQIPDLAGMLEEAGLAPVALYLLGSSAQDLVDLTALRFLPRATALVLNTGLVSGMPDSDAFETTLAQPQVKAAIAGGARVVWMPRLDPACAKHIEERPTTFRAAIEGSVRPPTPALNLYQRALVRGWLAQMEAAFKPIASWLP